MDLGIAGRRAIVCASSRGLGLGLCRRALMRMSGAGQALSDVSRPSAVAKMIRGPSGTRCSSNFARHGSDGDLSKPSAQLHRGLLEAAGHPSV
jgi:hypothetical protein